MGTHETIRTDVISNTVTTVRSLKNDVNNKKSSLNSVITTMDRSWNSPAGERAVAKFNSFNPGMQNYNTIIENYLNFLTIQVEGGYIDTETKNVQLAEQFK